MKVHQITEAPRVEPIVKSLPTSVDIKPGLIGADLKNKQWNLVDQDGKVLQRFSGANAQGDAEGARDKLRNQIKANVGAAKKADTTKADDVDPKNKDVNNSKGKNAYLKWAGRLAKFFVGLPVIGAAIQLALNGPQLEDAFDAYLRALAKHGYTDMGKCDAIGQIKKDGSNVPQDIAKTYTRVVELTAETISEAAIGAVAGMTTPLMYTVAGLLWVKLGIVSGGVTVVMSLIAGGAWLIGGPELIRRCFDALGTQDKFENYIAEKGMQLDQMCRLAVLADYGQDAANLTIGFGTKAFGESVELVEEKSESAIKQDLAKLIKSDPKILAAYKKGKTLKPKFDAKAKAS